MIYYLEINIMCMIILLLFQAQLRQKTGDLPADQKILRLLIRVTVMLCFFDMVAGILRGRQFYGAGTLIEISNLLYFEALAVISFLWHKYVEVRLAKNVTGNYKGNGWKAVPVILFTGIAALNPWTGFLFRVNENNLYERGPGVYLHWVIVWGYFVLATVQTLKAYHKEVRLCRSGCSCADLAEMSS